MSSATRNYATNLGRLLRSDRLLQPLVVAYYVTARCNLDCAYCEDFGLRRNDAAMPSLPLDDALHVLRVIRSGTDRLILTGGDPLLYPEIVALAARARRELRFRHLTLQTNGLLLPQQEALLSHVDRLVVSLDSTDPERWSALIGVPVATAAAITDNVRAFARRQREFGYRMVINCVLSPDTLSTDTLPADTLRPRPQDGALPGAEQVLEFCIEHGLLVSFSPQSFNNWPRYELLVSDEYQRFVQKLLARKRRGAPILGSTAYLRTVADQRPFSCYPALVPRVLPDGALIYPCLPIEKADNGQGGRPCNLRQVGSWAEALQAANGLYGPPPRVCDSCYQQCFIEPSLMQARPLAFLGEWLRYRATRWGKLATYAPG